MCLSFNSPIWPSLQGLLPMCYSWQVLPTLWSRFGDICCFTFINRRVDFQYSLHQPAGVVGKGLWLSMPAVCSCLRPQRCRGPEKGGWVLCQSCFWRAVGILTGVRARWSGVRIPVGEINISRIQNMLWTPHQPASWSLGTGVDFLVKSGWGPI